MLSASYVRESLGTRLTSRHFRNQLYHLREESPDDFSDFVAFALDNTPEITDLTLTDEIDGAEHTLDLYFVEAQGRTAKEINWLGDGVQVWLQVLFHIWSNSHADTVVLDEPDVYLHPDLQRRLVGIVEDLPGQPIIATHAPEILTEVGRESVIWIDRSRGTSQRARDSAAIEQLNTRLGSGFNLGMARALRSRVVLFVEGEDMRILKYLGRTLGADKLRHERGLAVIPLAGFSNWHQVEPFAWLSRDLLGDAVSIHVLLDRDYRADTIIHDLEKRLLDRNVHAHVWRRKELESYLLVPEAIARLAGLEANVATELFNKVVDGLRHLAQVGFLGQRQRDADRYLDPQTVMATSLKAFEEEWVLPHGRLALVPPKDVLAAMSNGAKDSGGSSFAVRALARELMPTEIPNEMADVILAVEKDLGAIIA